MKKLSCLVGVVAISAVAEAGTIRFVDDDAAAGGNGLSWDTAYRFLQDALVEASSSGSISAIHVAQGAYQPDQDEGGTVTPGDRHATFQLVNGVVLLGGFAGPGTADPDARDVALFETTLTGDLSGNDGPDFLNNDENSYHVVTGTGVDSTAIIDGFTVTAGNADDEISTFGKSGGGMINTPGSPTVNACVFRENASLSRGGGVANGSGCDVHVSNTTFDRNKAGGTGGGMFNSLAISTLVQDCTFIENDSGFSGGGLWHRTSAVGDPATIQRCEFVGNTALFSGGGADVGSSANSTITNVSECAFTGNTALGPGGLFANARTLVVGTDFVDNTPTHVIGEWIDGGGNSFSPRVCDRGAGNSVAVPSDFPTIQQAIDAACDGATITVAPGLYTESMNLAGKAIVVRSSGGPDVTTIDSQEAGYAVVTANLEPMTARIEGFTITGGGMLVFVSDPTVINCRFTGNVNDQGGAVRILAARPHFIGCEFSNNTANEGGAIFINTFASIAARFTNCTVVNNTALISGGGIWNKGSGGTFHNCIIWNNSPGQVFLSGGGTLGIAYSNVQGGWPGVGNIDSDPLFVNPSNGDYRIAAGSSSIDAGDTTRVPLDESDQDGDGNTMERLPLDLDGNPRFVNDPRTPDTGCGTGAIVDMGSYEFQAGIAFEANLGDIDGDGVVGIIDFLALLAAWGACAGECCLEDLDNDTVVGPADFQILLGNWG